jgi:glycosyltransferase involved in cell wall biosynthesis
LIFERSVASQCSAWVAVSDKEAQAAEKLLGVRPVQVISNGVDTSFFTTSDEVISQSNLLFAGIMNYQPNVEAAQFFCRDIFPLIQSRIPEVSFHIVGAKPVEEVKSLASNSIHVHGGVADLRPYYRDAALVVAPVATRWWHAFKDHRGCSVR